MAPLLVCDSAVAPCFHDCLTLFQRHSLQQSSPSHPSRLFPQSQQQSLPWDCGYAPAPSCSAFWWAVSLPRLCRATAQVVCVVLTPFRLSQISCLTFQQPQMLPFCPSRLSWLQGSHPCFTPHHRTPQPPCPSGPFTLLLCPLLPSSDQVLCGSVYSFPGKWSETPSVQLVLCEIFGI